MTLIAMATLLGGLLLGPPSPPGYSDPWEGPFLPILTGAPRCWHDHEGAPEYERIHAAKSECTR